MLYAALLYFACGFAVYIVLVALLEYDSTLGFFITILLWPIILFMLIGHMR